METSGPSEIADSGPMVEVAPGVQAPQHARMVFDGTGVPGIGATVTIGLAGGRYVVTSVELRAVDAGTVIESRTLRAVPLATWHRDVARAVLGFFNPVSHVERESVDASRARRDGPTNEALEHVVRRFRLARLVGDGPAQAVTDTFGLPRSTVTRWMATARERGLLGAEEIGVGGRRAER